MKKKNGQKDEVQRMNRSDAEKYTNNKQKNKYFPI